MLNKSCRLASIVLLSMTCSFCKNDKNDISFYFDELYPISFGFYFTYPSDTTIHPNKYDAANTVNDAIRMAVKSIEIWCYGFDESRIIQSLIEKRNSGITITIIGSQDQDYTGLENAGFKVLRSTKTGLQHAKIILIDKTIFISGTGNFTESGFFYNNNSFFVLRIPTETGDKISFAMDHENIPSLFIELPYDGRMLISPGHGKFIQSRLLQAILKAKYRIRYLIFSHTDPVITDALYQAAKRGILVEGIYDSSEFSDTLPVNSEANKLNKNSPWNLMIYLEGNRSKLEISPGVFHGGHLHHKTIIIDDGKVMTGSYNWSMSARDDNLETFYELNDIFVTSKFIDEFNRIQSQALYIPPNIFKPVTSPPVLTYDMKSNNICWENGIPENGFTVFSGNGIFFRAERFTPSKVESGCIFQGDRHSSSAGPLYGNTHLLSPDNASNSISRYVFSLNHSSNAVPGSMPCDNASCLPLSNFRSSINAGWIWTDGSYNFISYRIWDINGMSDELRFISSTAGLYNFVPGKGDAILYLKDDLNRIHAACVQDGLSMNGSIKYFVGAFGWENNSELLCINGE